MRALRPAIADDPRSFGKRAPFLHDEPPDAAGAIAGDFKLFALTFASGFVFVTVLIA